MVGRGEAITSGRVLVNGRRMVRGCVSPDLAVLRRRADEKRVDSKTCLLFPEIAVKAVL